MTKILDPNGLLILIQKFVSGTENTTPPIDWKSILFGIESSTGVQWTIKNLTPVENLIFNTQYCFNCIYERSIYFYAGAIQTFLTTPAITEQIRLAAITAGAGGLFSLFLNVQPAVMNPLLIRPFGFCPRMAI